MKWIEVIHLRSTERESAKLMLTVQSLIDEVIDEKSCKKIKMYGRALLDTDLAIQLSHDTKKMEIEGSQLGLRLTHALKEFGMVNHNVWVDIYKG
jgi:hypothetical protein